MLNIPISYQHFLENYAEQQPLLMTDACSKSLMSWQEFDQVLQLMEPDEQALQLFYKGQVSAAHYLDDTFEFGRHRKRINKHRFYEYLEHGATLVLNRAEDYCLIAKHLCHAIGKFSQQPTSSNIYINVLTDNTPKVSSNDTSAFGKHWDTHDVFIIQLMGEKRWQLFPPTLPLPLSHQTSQQTSQQLQHEAPTIPSADYVLREGDVLYIPRGWWHNVIPLNVDTLHLSVGTYGPTLTDYLLWALSTALPKIPTARRGFLNQNNTVELLKQVLESATPELVSTNNLSSFTHYLQARERLTGNFHTQLTLKKTTAKIDNQSSLSLTSVYPRNSLNQDIHVNGRYLKLSPVGQAVVKVLTQINYLPWEDLCAQLPQFSPSDIEISVLDLARYDLVNIT
jgi:ribosomal protein L16 Arg81 hydroxylase